MAVPQDFRSAFHGFHREDVVHYIEYLTNKHNAELSQLKAQLDAANAEIVMLRSIPSVNHDLEEQLSQCQAHCAELEQRLAQSEVAAEVSDCNAELETYRRAERVERAAKERSARICEKTNAILADTTAKVEQANAQMEKVADLVSTQLDSLQAAVQNSKTALKDAAASLYALEPAHIDE